MRSHKATGIIIKRQDFGEADRLITVFTKEQGKIHMKAKGVRKITSKRASHIELLNHVSLSFYKGQGMPVLMEAVTIMSYESIKKNLPRVGIAYHICELIDGLCPENEKQENIFGLLHNLLHQLGTTNQVSSVVHSFEIQLLTLLGYLSPEQQLDGAKASYFIESILERRLKSRQILPHLL